MAGRFVVKAKSSQSGSTKLKGKTSTPVAMASEEKHKNIVIMKEPKVMGGSFQDHLILLYGAVKIGKTKMSALFPGVYFLPTEPGYKAQKVRFTVIENWTDFRDFVLYAEEHKAELSTVTAFCVDTITNLSKFCMVKVCSERGVTHPSDEEWGKGWAAFYDEFMFWILKLCNLGKGVIFIAHENSTEVISRRMKITKVVPDLPKTTYGIINNLCDIILQMAYVETGTSMEELGELRCLYTKPSEIRDAGDRTGKLPEIIKFRTEEQAVQKILGCFSENTEIKKGGLLAKRK